jgi:starch synthase
LYDRKNDVTGIINGLDTKRWNPATDQALLAQYSWEDLSRRQINKQSLLAEFSLNPAPDIPLIILVSRMDPQKGVDLVSPALNSISDLPWQAILLGTGDPFLEESIHHLQDDFPDRIRAVLRFDTNLSRRLYSGADLLIMPSRYEPCGLSQMIAMHYGCIPVARSTGGLKDTICDDPEQRKTTGFLFNEPTHIGLANALRRALDIYTRPIIWRDIQHRGMVQDFSWHQSALAYANLYLDLHKRKI